MFHLGLRISVPSIFERYNLKKPLKCFPENLGFYSSFGHKVKGIAWVILENGPVKKQVCLVFCAIFPAVLGDTLWVLFFQLPCMFRLEFSVALHVTKHRTKQSVNFGFTSSYVVLLCTSYLVFFSDVCGGRFWSLFSVDFGVVKHAGSRCIELLYIVLCDIIAFTVIDFSWNYLGQIISKR